MTDPQLTPEIRSLPIPLRLQLVEEIWDSIVADEGSFQLTAEQQAELNRRLDAHEAYPERGRRWDDIRRDLHGE